MNARLHRKATRSSIVGGALLFLFFTTVDSAIGTTALVQGETPVSANELRSTLASEDPYAVALLLTRVGLLQFEEDVVSLLSDLWEGRKEKHPELPWRFVQSDLVRLEIGGVLLTLADSMIPGARIDRNELHEYAATLADNPEPLVVNSALSLLGSFDDERDVSRILSVARQERTGTFRSAIVTLALMCNAAASRALDELEQAVTTEGNRSFVVKTRKEWDGIKSEKSLCDQIGKE